MTGDRVSASDDRVETPRSVKDLFVLMLDLDLAERQQYLDGSTVDSETREELLRLLGYREQAEHFFAALSADLRPLVEQDPLLKPDTVLDARFRIDAFLARGGMGEVYAASDLELGGQCALKIMKPGLALRPGSLARFREEIRLSREISSPHVCRVYDVGRHQEDGADLIFLTMELLDGITLADRIFLDGAMPLDEVKPLIRQMADALDAAHQRGVLHRDFKSSNVILCEDGGARAVVTDFGLSQRMETDFADAGFLVDGATPAYAAPEQIEKSTQTQRTDVYSFGVVLYEMVTGSLPFTGEDEEQLLRRKLTETPESPRRRRVDLPKHWESVILRCLDRDPGRRFATAGEVATALGCSAPPTNQALSRRRLMLLAAAAVPVAAVVTWWSRKPSPVEELSVGVLPLAAEPDLQYIADGIADRLTDSLTQLPGLRVVARTAIQRFNDAEKNLAETGRKFHARYLIMGSVKRFGGRLHIAHEIVESLSGLQVWAGTEDLEEAEIERLNLTLCLAVTRSLHIEAQPEQLTAAEKRLTKNPQAYKSYLLGRYFAAMRTRKSLEASIEHLQAAVKLDPGFAAAYAALGYSWYDLSIREYFHWEPLHVESAKAAARALELDPYLWEGYLVIGCNKEYWEWDFRGALESFQRASDLNPQSPLPHRWYADMSKQLARFDHALARIEKAISLDPLSVSHQVERGTILFGLGQVDEAIVVFRDIMSRDPSYENALIPLADALERKGRLEEAIQCCEKAAALTQRASYALGNLGRRYGLASRKAEAIRVLEELQTDYKQERAFASDVAFVYLGLGEKDKAFEWLDLAVPRKDGNLIDLKIAIEYDPVRGDPRYSALLKRVGLNV